MLSCASGLPEGYSCTFAPASLSGSGIATLTISSTHDLVARGRIAGGWLMTFALVIFLPGLRRRGLRWTFVLIALVPLTILSGCSASRITGLCPVEDKNSRRQFEAADSAVCAKLEREGSPDQGKYAGGRSLRFAPSARSPDLIHRRADRSKSSGHESCWISDGCFSTAL